MNEFTRCNKSTGIYWLKNPIENINVRIRLKTLDGVALLPKFEDYSRTSNDVNIEELGDKAPEVYNVKWQEKLFSLFEYKKYSDVHNCNTDDEVNYYNILKNTDLEIKKIFTYVHGDYHFPLPCDKNINMGKSDILNLNSCLEKLQERYVSRIDSNSMKHLFKSEENMFKEEERWTAMHVMMDYSDYNEDSQLIIKRETRLLSLYHNASQNFLMVTPDVNSLETNPYQVESATGVMIGFEYNVEVEFDEEQCDDMTILLNKMSNMWHRKHKHVLNFVTPSIGAKLYQVNIDIISAEDFDMDDLYMAYNIKVPDQLKCSNELNGRTHRSGSTRNRCKTWHYSHNIELVLEADSIADPPPIKIFFEVISTDWWGRHRTEGYTCLFLSLTPGCNRRQLSCSRPEEKDSVQAEYRRFFVGGCHLLEDLEMLNTPIQEAKYKFVSTGTIDVRWSILSQSHQPRVGGEHLVTSSSAVLQGADAVLRQYSKARARLAAATKYLDT